MGLLLEELANSLLPDEIYPISVSSECPQGAQNKLELIIKTIDLVGSAPP